MPDDLNDDGLPPEDDILDDTPPDDDDGELLEDDGEPLEGEDDLDPVNDDSQQQQPTRREPTRAERRVAEAVRRAKDAEAERDRLRVEADNLRRAQAQPSPQQIAEYERQEQERLALMDPVQQTQYLLGKQQQQFQQQINALQFQTWDNGDKVHFDALAARTPAYAAVAADVEKLLAAERAAGRQGANRETVAQYLIGKRAVERASRAKTKQGKQGQQRIAQQAGRPGAAGSDVSAPGRKSGRDDSLAALEKRLAGIAI